MANSISTAHSGVHSLFHNLKLPPIPRLFNPKLQEPNNTPMNSTKNSHPYTLQLPRCRAETPPTKRGLPEFGESFLRMT